MKPSRAIATIALVISAILSLDIHRRDRRCTLGKTPGRCGVVPCPSSTGSAADVVADTVISRAQVTLWMCMPD